MAAGDQDRPGELRSALEHLLIVQDKDSADDYQESCIRRMSVVTIPTAYRGHDYDTQVVRKIVDTIGHHCAALMMRPEDKGAPEMGTEVDNMQTGVEMTTEARNRTDSVRTWNRRRCDPLGYL